MEEEVRDAVLSLRTHAIVVDPYDSMRLRSLAVYGGKEIRNDTSRQICGRKSVRRLPANSHSHHLFYVTHHHNNNMNITHRQTMTMTAAAAATIHLR